MEDVFEDEVNYYLVLELVSGGELFEHLITKGSYSEKTAAAILRDLADALRFLHKRGIVHADLKPENLMLSSWNDFDAKARSRVFYGSSVCLRLLYDSLDAAVCLRKNVRENGSTRALVSKYSML